MEKGRVQSGPLASKAGDRFGAFIICHQDGRRIYMIVDDGSVSEWEHVSITVAKKHNGTLKSLIPTWDLMAMAKDLFWEEEETVVQFHPPKSQYVNNHEACLHLWKSKRQEYLVPPTELIGVK